MRITKKIIPTPNWQIPRIKVMAWAILSCITTKSHYVPYKM
jgi:hypothetical protein